MKNFFFGFVFGSAISSVGFQSIAPMLDSGINTIQQTTVNAVRTNSSNVTPTVPYVSTPPAPQLPSPEIRY